MKVPLLDLKKQFEGIKDEIMAATEEVYQSQQFILGPKVAELEDNVATYCKGKYAVGVSSGTDALLISLMAAGVGIGDVVVTTPYTFFATVGAIVRVGAQPLFVDIDSKTYNMDPGKLEDALSALGEQERSRVKAVIPIHLYGQCADMEPILKIAEHYGLAVVEDAAQAIGAEYQFQDGRVKKAGAMGSYGCFSFYPTKNLGAAGEGGMVVTQDETTYNHLKILRNHGDIKRYEHGFVGGNFRLHAIQAAVLIIKLKYLDEWTNQRIANANSYRNAFKEAGLDNILLPVEKEKRHVYHQFVLRVEKGRDRLKAFLNENDIGCEVYYPVPLHMQACFRHMNYAPEDFPESKKAALETLALPIYPELGNEEIYYVVDNIKKFMKIEKKEG
ncbi:MAG: DegT/DnrJ/EryC1/StrS family aminotransferase [Deltaproteobacteria bacterium]|nr:DegT/DnrJ/EryC1/StrS family aminotransferase [Deltaproteobacteria bacterium]